MKLCSEFSGQIACEIDHRQNLRLITLVYCFSRFVSLWPLSTAPLNFVHFCPVSRGDSTMILVSTNNAIAPGFAIGHNDRFLIFLSP